MFNRHLSRTSRDLISWVRSKRTAGLSLHEVIIAAAILAMTVVAMLRAYINSTSVITNVGVKQIAETAIQLDFETVVRRRFYSFRCNGGPCMYGVSDEVFLANQNKPLSYYDQGSPGDRSLFLQICKSRTFARALLDESVNGVSLGSSMLTSPALTVAGVTIERRIELEPANENIALLKYLAARGNSSIAMVSATLVPNAVHWCP